MVAIDTNIIVRFLTRDDENQFQRALALFEEEKAIYIPDTVLLETEWVLRFAYDFSPAETRSALTKLLGLPNVEVADAEAIASALEWQAKGLDFADALHLAKSPNAKKFLTFDAKFIKKAKGLSNCHVESP